MKRTTKYIALDVHQATTVASVREESARVIARTVLPTEASALVDFFRGMRGAVHVAWEEGTQAQWLHELVTPLVDRVVVCDRRGESQAGNKRDNEYFTAHRLDHIRVDTLHGRRQSWCANAHRARRSQGVA